MICWIESVDPVADLCLPTNQIYSGLLNAFDVKEITEVQNADLKMLLQDGETPTRSCKNIKFFRNAARRCRSWKMTKRDYPRMHLLKYYPCASSFVK